MNRAATRRMFPTLLFVTGLVPAVQSQSTWYVDVHGTPPGSGTSGDPYASVQFAIDQPTTVDGDLILVRPGTYVENVDFRAKGLVLESTAGAVDTVLTPSDPLQPVIVANTSGRPVRVEGFTVTGSESHGVMNDLGVGAALLLRRCIIHGNEGSGVHSGWDTRVESSTIADNFQGVDVPTHVPIFEMENSIVWGNQTISNYQSGFLIAFCDLQEGAYFTNISADPLFWDPLQADYFLSDSSPAIDAGDPSAPRDPDGSRIDMGALPFDAAHLPEPRTYCTPKVNSCLTVPRIHFSGTPSSSAGNGFVLSATDTRATKAGLVLYTDSGPGAVLFQGGILCVGTSPIRRSVSVVDTNGTAGQCDGTLALDMNAFAAGALGGNPLASLRQPGTQVNAQFWARDTLGHGSLLTDAVQYFVLP